MAWAEDRAPWRHDPSAVPGAKTEGGAARCRPIFPFRDWHEGGKSLPSDQACSLPYLPTPVSPFHAEPTHTDLRRANESAVGSGDEAGIAIEPAVMRRLMSGDDSDEVCTLNWGKS